MKAAPSPQSSPTRGEEADIAKRVPSPLMGEGQGEGEMPKSRLTSFAKSLRKNSTDTENCLWKHLRSKRFSNIKFRRQQPIGKYIVDFVCFEKRVVVECDGGQHALSARKDGIRDNWLKKEGFKVLRFWDNEVLQTTDVVLEMIFNACERIHPPPNPRPSRAGELNER